MTTAIVVLDVQRGLFNTSPRPYQAIEVLRHINSLTEKARASNMPVIFMQYESPNILPFHSEAWQLHESLQVQAKDIVLRKPQANAFIESELQKVLLKLQVDTLLLCGYASEFCIDSTLRYATTLGYQIILVSDAHTTHDKDHLSAANIRHHHNISLSMSPVVRLIDTQAALDHGLI